MKCPTCRAINNIQNLGQSTSGNFNGLNRFFCPYCNSTFYANVSKHGGTLGSIMSKALKLKDLKNSTTEYSCETKKEDCSKCPGCTQQTAYYIGLSEINCYNPQCKFYIQFKKNITEE